MRLSTTLRRAAALLALPALALVAAPAAGAATVRPLPANAPFDYQIGGDYTPAAGVTVVSRDWFKGAALTGTGTYSICYVNAFQTQDDEAGVVRPDEKSAWPANLVLTSLGDDPNWGGEYLIDISTAAKRTQAAQWVQQMTDACAAKGFAAVEFDNLDSWTRFDGTPVASRVPFEKPQAIAYAELITDYAHAKGLAVAQKNTSDLGRAASLTTIGFDFAVAEECGQYRECDAYTSVFGNKVVAIEYRDAGFTRACTSVGSSIAVVRRNVDVTPRGTSGYRFATC